MKKILIIGKNSFIGSNLNRYLKKFYEVKCLSFEKVINKENNFFQNFNYVINTSIHKKYIDQRYKLTFDLDRKFIQKFTNLNFIYIFLNSRKIYLSNSKISENSKKKPLCFYSKNKLTTEKFLKKKLGSKLLSLRVSNIIGPKLKKNKRNNHKLFFDNYLKMRKQNKPIVINDDFKDFLSIDQFSKIIQSLIKNNVSGIYNVSISEKIYLSEMLKWIDKNFYKKIVFLKESKESFYLSNKKLLKKIEKKPLKSELRKFCEKILK